MKTKTIRYAVVGLGDFAQEAVLPGFKEAKNSELVALVSGDPAKLRQLGKKYQVSNLYSYEEYDECLKSGEVDAVYIVLPNNLHATYAERAAKAGVHVLCEKPLACSEREAQSMIQAAKKGRVKLMTAYRLHFEQTNLEVIDLVRKGRIGDPKYFSSVFSHQVKPGNIRARRDAGGGCLWDMGIYCINAARYIFGAEPTEVFAITANTNPKIFKGVDEISAATLRFPGDRLAQFTASQGSGSTSQYRVVGTKGDINVEPAYDYSEGLSYKLTIGDKVKSKAFPKRDQIAAEIMYFSECLLNNKEPEPSGQEGLADVRIIAALYKSAAAGRPMSLSQTMRVRHPKPTQLINRPSHGPISPIHAEAPSAN